MNLKRTIELFKEYLRMNNIIELTDVTKYRLDEINKIRDYFNNEIKERKDLIKKLNKYLVILKNIFACLFSVHNTISLSRHEQVCLMRLRFERYFSHQRVM